MYGSSALETIVTSATFAESPLKLSRMTSTIPVLDTSSAVLIAIATAVTIRITFDICWFEA